MKDDRVYLDHILECIRRIEEDVRPGRDAFMASHTLQDAVLRNLHTLAESTQRLSAALRQAHPEVEWRRIAAFRNVVVHDYLGIDLERMWEITQSEVPGLKPTIQTMLAELRDASASDEAPERKDG
ncbi:MAG: DUF86 domain-containing protein [Planctomycetes bacterium]|nr:DUF86 domain-containing protein [Planctomycetota bacterium]